MNVGLRVVGVLCASFVTRWGSDTGTIDIPLPDGWTVTGMRFRQEPTGRRVILDVVRHG